MVAAMAMVFLAVFGALAVGFYAATNTSAQVASNERRVVQASLAAESGMDFMRFQLAQVVIPHGTPLNQIFPSVCSQLITRLGPSANFAGKPIVAGGLFMYLPYGNGQYVTLDSSGNRFRAILQNMGQKLRVRVIGFGSDGITQRIVQMDYDLAQRASAIFDYGVASRGKIVTGGSSRIKGATDPAKGSVLSTCTTDPIPVTIKGKEVSGDISVTNPNATIVVNGASVGGTTDPAEIFGKHVHKGVDEPEFPTIDVTSFMPYVTNTYNTAGNNNNHVTLVNCRIPANTNPTFAGGCTIQGVLYVETPNVVTFRGNADIQGVIITPNSPSGTLATNRLDFSGSVSASGVESLPPEFGDLRKLTGSFVLAPGFEVDFSGNFGTVNGSIIGSRITMTGSAEGTIMGSIINLDNTEMDVTGSSEVVIASTGTSDYPAGVFFSSTYAPLPDTYEEVKP